MLNNHVLKVNVFLPHSPFQFHERLDDQANQLLIYVLYDAFCSTEIQKIIVFKC